MSSFMHSRRDCLRYFAFGAMGPSLSGWLPALAGDVARSPQRRRSCILLWMPGGPSQIDTFDLKSGHPNGGEFQPIETSVPGIQISEHLPRLAMQMEDVAIVRSMSTKEGDHARASHHLRTGYLPQGPVRYPTLGSLISHELADEELDLPGFVSIMPTRFFGMPEGAGFLGPARAPLVVGAESGGEQVGGEGFGPPLQVRDLVLPEGIQIPQADARLELLGLLDQDFAETRPGLAGESHRAAYRQAVRMMRSPAVRAFDLDEESISLRERYGRHRFGQSCLLARRLVEQGVPFVEVSLSGVDAQPGLGWDTHTNNFGTVRQLSALLDSGWATLMEDLRERGLLETTLVVWMGEFGRTPRINGGGGRDHYPNAWTTVLAGGGIRGGRVYGATSANGMDVEDHPVTVPDFLATVCTALGIDPTRQNMSNVGRPIRIVDPESQPIYDILA